MHVRRRGLAGNLHTTKSHFQSAVLLNNTCPLYIGHLLLAAAAAELRQCGCMHYVNSSGVYSCRAELQFYMHVDR